MLDAQIVVKLEEAGAQVQAELTLEDRRGQAKEWRLLLPPGAAPTVKTLPEAAYQWVFPNGKNAHHVLQLKEPSLDKIGITVQATAAWPVAKLAVGPFTLAGALFTSKDRAGAGDAGRVRGRRLVYHRFGNVSQVELPKSPGGLDSLAYFKYALPAPGPAAAQAPLELELKASSGLAETQADHVVRLKGDGDAWYVETTTRIQAKSLGKGDFLDVHLPRIRLTGLEHWVGHRSWAIRPRCPDECVAHGGTRGLGDAARSALGRGRSEQRGPDGARRARLKWSRQTQERAADDPRQVRGSGPARAAFR